MSNYVLEQYEYHVWANRRVLDVLAALPRETFRQQIQSVFPTIADLLSHMYTMDGMWLSVMQEDRFEETMRKLEQLKTEVEGRELEEIAELFNALSVRFSAFLNGQEDHERPLHLSHPKFGEADLPLSRVLQHIVNHGTYHRGHLSAMLRQLGYASPPTDYLFFLFPTTGPQASRAAAEER